MEAKKVVVTGASKGIGFELVKYLSKNGHHVLAITRNKDSIINLQKNHKHITVLELEITREIDVNAIRDFVASTWGNIDAIIHNAGKLIHRPFFKTTLTDFMEVYKVNVFAVAELTKLEVRRDYYPGGQVKIAATYNKEGNLEGVRREYAEDGSIAKSYIFRNGMMIGEGIVTEKGEKDGSGI